MLTIQGARETRFCDGVSRRGFLRIGTLALGAVGGFNLRHLLAAEDAKPSKNRKSVINIFLPGGPPHQDMWDLKMDAPSNIRGEFSPIKTSVPGIEICELFPKMAAMMQRFTIIRSIVGSDGQHAAYQCFTGRPRPNSPPGNWPSMGAVVSKLQGPAVEGVPAFVGLSPKMGHMPWADPGEPGFLGIEHCCFNPNGGASGDMVLKDISIERLKNRREMLKSFDKFRRDADDSGAMEAMDAFGKQAYSLLTSGRLAEALDIEKEDAATRDRYGRGTMKCRDDGGPECPEQFLLARRLVEAGVRCVTIGFNRWDWHNANFAQARVVFPQLDAGLTSLVSDLHDRGLDKDVAVVVWGEFGRTPVINKEAGRDHWPKVSCAALACGGMRHGQVIGSTDRTGGEANSRPVDFQDVFATLYQHLGIDAKNVTLNDMGGRPQYLVEGEHKAIGELVG